MLNCYFVTGTDTGVGKTFVSAALLTRAGQQGLKTAALKPVAAGAEPAGAGLCNEDALVLQAAVGRSVSCDVINPVCLRDAIAPHIAAADEGVELSVKYLAEKCAPFTARDVDFALVEGAGGWRVPLNSRETLADFAVYLKAPVIMVVAMRLGCLNHALLTAQAIVGDGLQIAGWVANSPQMQPMPRYAENVATLKSMLDPPLLGEIAFAPDRDFNIAAAALKLPAEL